MMTKNLKHGVKCYKKDVELECKYVVLVPSRSYSVPFITKMEAINNITDILSNTDIKKEDVVLTKVSLIKF